MNFYDVPVIDFMALTTYFGHGAITDLQSENIDVESKKVREIRLWNSRNEFKENFPNYLTNPTILEDLKFNFKIRDHKITLDTAKPQIFLQVAEIINPEI